jgi:hypothetical protein
LTAIPHWPGSVHLEALAQRANAMTVTSHKARLMAAICSAADEHPPQLAVDSLVNALRGLTDDPQNSELHLSLFNSLAKLRVPPTSKMTGADRQRVLDPVLAYATTNSNVAAARSRAITNALGYVDFLSPAPIDTRLYDTALTLPDEYDRALATSAAARRIAEQMQGAKPDQHATLATRASDLVNRTQQLQSNAFLESLPDLRAVLPDITHEQKKNLLGHVLALPQDDPNRKEAIDVLLESRAVLGQDLTNALRNGTGI